MPFPTHPHLNEVLVDPHSHSRFSDGLSSPRRMFIYAKARGLRGLVITDHDTVRHWEKSLEAARRTEMATALGVEISTAQGHLLAYFSTDTLPRRVTRALKLDEGEIHYMDVSSVVRRVHELGGLTCAPHPFGPFYPLGEEHLGKVDAVEEYNSWIFRNKKRFHNAFGYGDRHKIAAMGGSDSHYPYTLGFGATAVPAAVDLSKPDWLLHCIREKLTRPIVRQNPIHRRINYLKSAAVSIPMNMRYNVRFFRSKWRGYWRKRYQELLQRSAARFRE